MHIYRQSPLASWSRVQVEEILYSSDVENLKEKKFSWPLYFLSEYDTSEIQFITCFICISTVHLGLPSA